jgi:phosphotransferase system HPr (HPr) family protein
MNGHPVQSTVIITNPQGFHMRPKAAFAQRALSFQSDIRVTWEGTRVNGKSMMDLFLIAAPQGDAVTIEADGPDAPAALGALVALLRNTSEEDELSESTGD